MYNFQVKSSQPIVFFSLLIFLFAFFHSSVAFADIVYISEEGSSIYSGVVNYVKQTGPETFGDVQQITSGDIDAVFALNQKDKQRVAVIAGDYDSFWSKIMIYNPEDLSSASVSNYVPGAWITGYAQLDGNILLADEKGLEMFDPDTGDITTLFTITQDVFYRDMDYILVHNDTIYLSIRNPASIVIMDKSGKITGTVTGIDFVYADLVSSGEKVYLAAYSEGESLGIYNIDVEKIKNLEITSEDLLNNYAVQVVDVLAERMCADGNGGLFYTVLENENSTFARYIYHWNGSTSEKIYDAGEENYFLNPLRYDENNETLFALLHDASTEQYGYEYGDVIALRKDSNGQFKLIKKFEGKMNGRYNVNLALISQPSEEKNNETPSEDNTPSSQDLSAETKNSIADTLGITSPDIKYVKSSDMTDSQNPTSSITNAISDDGYEIVSTQKSLTVNESGYYVFTLNVPSNLAGTNTNLKVYLADRSVFTNTSVSSSALPDGITEASIFSTEGKRFTTIPSTILAAVNLNANGTSTFSTHIAKASSKNESGIKRSNPGSGGGGCNAGTGLFASIMISLSATAVRKIKTKK